MIDRVLKSPSRQPTSYPEINILLSELLNGARTALGDYFVGLYLYGSLASGDFDPPRSDVDFLCAVTESLPEASVQALEALHRRLWASGGKWAAKLEGSYVPITVLRRHDPSAPPCATVNEGRFYLGDLGADWIFQRHILRQYGVAVAGPDIRTLIDPVSPGDLRRAELGFLDEWWKPMLADPTYLLRREYQAYAVLTMCRIRYTLAKGEIASKPASAHWAMETLDERWTDLIAGALAWPDGPQADQLEATLDFIRATVEGGR